MNVTPIQLIVYFPRFLYEPKPKNQSSSAKFSSLITQQEMTQRNALSIGRNTDVTADIEALDQNKLDTYDVIAVRKLSNSIKEDIQAASGIFTTEDQERWAKKLEATNATSTTELKKLEREIDEEKNAIQKMIVSYTRGIEQNRKFFGVDKKRKIDTAEQYITEFREQPYETKLEWLALLDSEIQGLKSLFEEAQALAPESMAHFSTLRRSEKKTLIESLRKNNERIAAVQKILQENANDYTADEVAQIKTEFHDLTPSEQPRYLAKLHHELDERKKYALTYNGLPPKYQTQLPNFTKLGLDEKKGGIDQLIAALTSDYQKGLFSTEHICLESKLDAFTWFVSAPINKRGEAFQLLHSQIEFEARLSAQFEEEAKKLPPTEINGYRTKFYNSPYEKKVGILSEIEEKTAQQENEKDASERCVQDYTDKIDKFEASGVLSQDTAEKLRDWFENKTDLTTKKRELALLGSRMEPRIETKNRFERLLSKKTQEENKRFYTLGHHDRNDLLKELLDKEDALANKEKAKTSAITEEKKVPENDQKLNTAQTKEKVDATTETSVVLTQELEHKIAAAQNASTLKKERQDYTILNEFAQATKSSDLLNQNIDATSKDNHLTDAEAAIQDELAAFSGKVIDKDGEAVDLVTLDLNNLTEMTGQERYSLLVEARGKQLGAKTDANSNNYFQINNNGRMVSGQNGLNEAMKREAELKARIADEVIADVKKDKGNIDTKTAKKIQEMTEEQDVSIKLAA